MTEFRYRAGHLVVTADDGIGKLAMEVEDEGDEGSTLLEGAGVLGFAVGVEAAFVADADGAAVEGAAVCAHFIQASVLGDGAILADVEVIADVDEASREVVVLQLLGSVVTVLTRGGAVDDEIADGVGGHEDARLDVCKEFVLGGDLVATDGKRECFLDHRLLRLGMLIQCYSLAGLQSCHARGDAEKTCNRCDDCHHSVEDFLSSGLSFKKLHFLN